MNLTSVREIIHRLWQAREAFADGATDYGDELLRDLVCELEEWVRNREEATRRARV